MVHLMQLVLLAILLGRVENRWFHLHGQLSKLNKERKHIWRARYTQMTD